MLKDCKSVKNRVGAGVKIGGRSMRILIVPDVHGSHELERAKSFPEDSYDFIVFLGDYFDSWENEWPDQGENFVRICDFVRENRDRRKMLIGNHDWSYISKGQRGGSCSGHQGGGSRLWDTVSIVLMIFCF